jgi:hypothetical protein
MAAVQQHFVTFYSPGTFVAEATERPIAAWDTDAALAMAAEITERYGATPYGFRFTTRGRAVDELDSRVIATSPMHYFGVKVETLEEVKARATDKDSVLLANMECNGYDRIVTTTKGWRWTQPLSADDIVLEAA